MAADEHQDVPSDEAFTHGTPAVTQPPVATDLQDASTYKIAVPADQPNGFFVGPPEEPDRYELLGDGIPGGEGITWKARYRGELTSPLPLAIKLLNPPHDAGPGWPSARDQQRWRDHAVLLRHLKLDHVVRLDEVFLGAPPHPSGGVAAGRVSMTMPYLVMEWVEGPTLHALLARKPARHDTVRQRLEYVAQAGEALASLASVTRSGGNPSLHRDVKPTNCIVHPERGLVLIDVSTLRLIDDGYDFAGWHTPAYTSPEVLAAPHLARAVTADVYSLGALTYFCLTGEDPPPSGASGASALIGSELRTVAQTTGASDAARFTSHILAALDGDPSRRPADLRTWSRGLLAMATPPDADSTIHDAGGPPREEATDISHQSARYRLRRLSKVAAVVILVVLASGALQPESPARTNAARGRDLAALPAASGTISATPARPTPSSLTGNPTGTIDFPTDGAAVKYCSYFSGTASLPPGTTLILAKKNIVNGDPNKYVEVVFGYDDPSKLGTWKGAQYFGGETEGGVGQRYLIELIAVRLERARKFHDSEMEIGEVQALVRSGTSLADVEVRRVASPTPNQCPGPPK